MKKRPKGGMHPANSYEASEVSVPVGVLVGRSPPLNFAIRTPSVGWRCRDHSPRGIVRAFRPRRRRSGESMPRGSPLVSWTGRPPGSTAPGGSGRRACPATCCREGDSGFWLL
jgi:hypothetical protein